MASHYLSLDLGADSGRVILGTLNCGKITLEEIHRFSNKGIRVNGSIRWDLLRIFDELKIGLKKAAQRKLPIKSLSTDSWGVDYVLLKGQEPMLSLPYQYRDSRTDHSIERVRELISDAELFAESGIMFMSINTLYQLFEDKNSRPEILEMADTFLNIGDYFNWLFSGVAAAETSLASTTQLYNPQKQTWSMKIAKTLGIPEKIFPKLVPAGTQLGNILPEIVAETGLPSKTQVVASCSHDTGAAVAAMPAEAENDWAFLSCGTWSLLGIESNTPFINDEIQKANYTNEVGFGNTTRLLKNIVGMWIQQETMRTWKENGCDYTPQELDKLAEAETPLRSIIDPEDPRFLKPGEMPQKIIKFCEETNQAVPETPGQFIRCILESLAKTYCKHLDKLEELTGRQISTLHVVGGGSRSDFFMKLVANITKRKVVAGPVEGTSCGNILIQAYAAGELRNINEIRQVVRNSFELKTFSPA